MDAERIVGFIPFFKGGIWHKLWDWEMDTTSRVQILDLAVGISASANALGKGTNPSLHTPAMSK